MGPGHNNEDLECQVEEAEKRGAEGEKEGDCNKSHWDLYTNQKNKQFIK